MKDSLQFRLAAWLSAMVLLATAVAGAASFTASFHEANELQDWQLEQVAAMLSPQSLAAMERDGTISARVKAVHDKPELVVQRLDAGGGPLALPASLPDGVQDVEVGGVAWRVVVRTLDAATRVAVGQQTAGRNDVAESSALATTAPLVVFVPVLVFVLGIVVRRMFAPLRALSAAIDRRDSRDLSSLPDAGLPDEIRPFVVALNRLLARVGQSVAAQRRFIADAAHELRSPLTALSLQAERLEPMTAATPAHEQVRTLRRGLARGSAMVEQLLSFARIHDVPDAPDETLSVAQTCRQVLEDLMPLADRKRIDIGVLALDEAAVRARPLDLRMLVRNLVDNAIRYTPDHGRIDLAVRVTGEGVELTIDDSGPGIAPEERERVFDAFYRIVGNRALGSGLGLAIVKTIVERLGARIELGEAGPGGLRVTVTIPGAP
ncbi:sensor histidine kinase [Burkholderia plantarii]|uniref:histidine kinase n=1 Tax=Burkholderia plantarii TaxID=41899 RepID=A0A0B6S5D7_BURPL|nr:ATP-binding protein [Burkholderia plantarii]AJK48535.1 sensor protein QseC [Burkholderia plantarii]ALK32745.1 sensory histidine kinase [Burkholderia plantarii]GLZ22820.1 two-component sensor histidine kinase [Burkholderia plantarii]